MIHFNHVDTRSRGYEWKWTNLDLVDVCLLNNLIIGGTLFHTRLFTKQHGCPLTSAFTTTPTRFAWETSSEDPY